MTTENITTTPAPESATPTCPECGAMRFPGESNCWLCNASLPQLSSAVEVAMARRFQPQQWNNSNVPQERNNSNLILAVFGGLWVLLLVGLVLSQAYGVLIPLLVLGWPFLVAAVLLPMRQGSHQEKRDRSPSSAVAGCLGVVVVIVPPLLFAIAWAFFLMCKEMLHGGPKP